MKLVFVASPLTLKSKSKDSLAQNHNNVSEWMDISIHRLRIRIMCQSGGTCLPTDCCFSKLLL